MKQQITVGGWQEQSFAVVPVNKTKGNDFSTILSESDLRDLARITPEESGVSEN